MRIENSSQNYHPKLKKTQNSSSSKTPTADLEFGKGRFFSLQSTTTTPSHATFIRFRLAQVENSAVLSFVWCLLFLSVAVTTSTELQNGLLKRFRQTVQEFIQV